MKTLLLLFLSISFLYPKLADSQCFMSYIYGGMLVETTTGNKDLDLILHTQEADLELFFGLNVNLLFGTELNSQGNAFFSPDCQVLIVLDV